MNCCAILVGTNALKLQILLTLVPLTLPYDFFKLRYSYSNNIVKVQFNGEQLIHIYVFMNNCFYFSTIGLKSATPTIT